MKILVDLIIFIVTVALASFVVIRYAVNKNAVGTIFFDKRDNSMWLQIDSDEGPDRWPRYSVRIIQIKTIDGKREKNKD